LSNLNLAKKFIPPYEFIFVGTPSIKEEFKPNNSVYKTFKQLNSKEELIRRMKEEGSTINPLKAKFLMEDGSFTGTNITKFREHGKIIEALEKYDIKGFKEDYWKKYGLPERCRIVLLKFLLWHTNALRLYITKDCLAVQVWIRQVVRPRQWEKLDYIINLLKPKLFAWDIEALGRRYIKEVPNPKNALSLKVAYKGLREDLGYYNHT